MQGEEDLCTKLKILEDKRERLGLDFMNASSPEEVEYVKGEMIKLDYEIKSLEEEKNRRISSKKPAD